MLKKILIALFVCFLVFLGLVAVQPAEFTLSRSATMAAPPADVFAQVNDFHKWEQWSPWARIDPNMQTSFAGPASGEGAMYSWVGNNEVGEGKMTILKSQAPEKVAIQLDFIKPMAATNLCEFTFKPEAAATLVTWTMGGTHNFVGKAFGLFMDIETLVGGDFEKGLAQLKAVVEAPKK